MSLDMHNTKMKTNTAKADRLVGFSMLVAATAVFVYYTVWTLFMVRQSLDNFPVAHSY